MQYFSLFRWGRWELNQSFGYVKYVHRTYKRTYEYSVSRAGLIFILSYTDRGQESG